MVLKKPLLKLLGIFLVLKLSYFLLAWMTIQFNWVDLNFGSNTFFELAMRKDAFWYKKLTILGYPLGILQTDGTRILELSKGLCAWAFFPAYPLFNKCLSVIFSISYETAAFISSLLFSIAALCGSFLFCKNYWKDTSKAFFTTLVIFIFPFQFYFSMFLTEAPFFAFLIWSFYAIQKNKLLLASLLLIPLVLIRPNGLLMLLPIFLFFLESKNLPYIKCYQHSSSFAGILMCLPAVLCFIAYSFYQYQSTGYYLAFSEAQKGWNKTFTFPLLALFRQGNLNYQVTSWYVIVVSLFTIQFRKRMPWSFKMMILISILLPLTAGSTYSMIRYLSIAFPIFLVLSSLGFHFSLRKKCLTLLLLYILHMGSFYLWLVDHPLGF